MADDIAERLRSRHDDGGAPPTADDRRKVRLTPPPRPQTRAASPPEAAIASRKRIIDRALPLATPVLFGFLGLGAVLVFGLLPRWIAPTAPPLQTGSEPAALFPAGDETLQPEDPQSVHGRAAAEQLLSQVLSAEEAADGLNVELWGGTLLARARAASAEGDEYLAGGRFDRATEAYGRAVGAFEELLGRADEVVRRALEDGANSLEAGDGDAAASAFTLALAVEPDNPLARRGLMRAEVAEQVAAHLTEATSLEGAGAFDSAAESYRRALALDGDTERARSGLARARARLRDDAFGRAMAEGLEALDREDLDAARTALGRALELRPEAREAREALARVEDLSRIEAIDQRRKTALEYERREEWRAAAREYSAVLEIDGRIRFARDGQARTTVRADLSDALDAHIARPERLSEEAVLAEARKVLDEVGEVVASADIGPRLGRQIDELRALVDAWATPVPVILESDTLTEVTIYRVGRFGTFERRELQLRPGTYTVVGSRLGYRDERLTLVVHPGSAPEPFVVRCREAI